MNIFTRLRIKLDSLRIVLKDNGFFRGLKIAVPLVSQLYFKFPKSHLYTYNMKPLNRKIKFLNKNNVYGPATLIDVFGWRPYHHSSNGKLTFEFDENSKVLDLGAFVGDTAVFFAIQGAKVHSYEPQIEAYKAVQENVALNNLRDKVNVYNSAVTIDGRKLRFENNNQMITGMFSATKEDLSASEVQSVSLNKVLSKEKKWDLIKIDIEGGEYELLGYFMKNKSCLKNIKSFIIEFEDIPAHIGEINNFMSLLKKYGFELDYRFGYLGMLYAKKTSRTNN